MTMEGFGSVAVEWWLDRLLDLRVAAMSFLLLTLLTRLTWKSIVVRCKKDIPEPPAWPVIGHIHLFGELPHQRLMKLAGRYGPLMSLRLGTLRIIVATDAAMAKEFLKTQDAVWASRSHNAFAEFFFYNYNDMVLQPLNDVWRKLKKIFFSEFLSITNVEKQKDDRHESTMCLVNSLLASARENKSINVYAAVAYMSSYQMTKLIFGKRLCSEYTARVSTAGEKKTLAELISDLATVNFLSLGECFPWLKWLDLDGVVRKLKNLHSLLDSYLCELLEERHRQLLDGGEDDDSMDLSRALLSFLDKEDGCGLTYLNIKGAIADMLSAGIETTTALVTFAVAEVMRHPDAKQKLVKELDDVVGRERLVDESDLVNLNYLKMVVKETLRLHPPLPLLLSHASIASSVVAGYHIPEGTQVFVNVYAIHRDPQYWEDPLSFKPERFSDNSIDLRGQHFELLPFGSGRRQCPGMNMGLATSELVLARLFHCLDISLPPGMKPADVDMTEKTGAATALANPLRVVVSTRLPEEVYSMCSGVASQLRGGVCEALDFHFISDFSFLLLKEYIS